MNKIAIENFRVVGTDGNIISVMFRCHDEASRVTHAISSIIGAYSQGKFTAQKLVNDEWVDTEYSITV